MSKIKVLIVEDDPMVADINKKFTQAVEGFTVVGIANNGHEAQKMIEARQPDLIVLDVYMPEMDGIELLKNVRGAGIPTDVILITAANDNLTIDLAMRDGIFDYIVKPFKFERYHAALEAYREFKKTLTTKERLNQQDIDNVIVARRKYKNKELPKNLHEHTMTKIFQFLNGKQPLSADEVANGVGISRVTARRYLEYLSQQGFLVMTLDYAAIGRPIHRYHAAASELLI